MLGNLEENEPEHEINDLDQDKKRRAIIDAHVGARIRVGRNGMGLSAKDLGCMLGVRYQQINFYETGHNKISAGNLFLVAEALDVPVSFFFDDMPDHVIATNEIMSDKKTDRFETLNIFFVKDIKAVKREIWLVSNAFYSIKNTSIRKGIIEFMKILGKELK